MISFNTGEDAQRPVLDPVWALGPEGPVAAKLGRYEARPQQLELTRQIDKAFEAGYHLVAEAGTGIGKSYAYLAPAIKWAVQSRRKTVISTYTISLQEQLIQKDIPTMHQCLGVDFVAMLAKGRSNYICLRRLEQARKKGLTLFDSSTQLETLEHLGEWARHTKDGSLSDLPRRPPGDVWEMVCSDNYTCGGKQCRHQEHCFYQLARRRMYSADILVANHAMLFSDLAVKMQGGKVLPDFGMVVLDEAHNVEGVASKHFGLRLSNFQVYFMLNRLYNTRTQKGLLAGLRSMEAIEQIAKAWDAAEMFYDEVMAYDDQERSGNERRKGSGRVREANVFENVLSGPLSKLADELFGLGQSLNEKDSMRLEVESYSMRCREFAAMIQGFNAQQMQGCVYWVESNARETNRMAQICAAPLHIGATMREALYEKCRSVVMTSATISTQGMKDQETVNIGDGKQPEGFGFFLERLGLRECRTVQLGSPFNYREQVKVYVTGELPMPREQEQAFMEAATEQVKRFLVQTAGKAFVLFTNFKQLTTMAESLEGFCREHELELLVQGRGVDRSRLLAAFRENTNSVLLGTDSFWQGVDVPGESLSNVIIVKLPFSVPDHPLLQGRLEQIEAQGGSGFMDYQLPEAILKFKQGFGRLIRTASDKGIVVILDPRVVKKRYGQMFLTALPACEVQIV